MSMHVLVFNLVYVCTKIFFKKEFGIEDNKKISPSQQLLVIGSPINAAYRH